MSEGPKKPAEIIHLATEREKRKIPLPKPREVPSASSIESNKPNEDDIETITLARSLLMRLATHEDRQIHDRALSLKTLSPTEWEESLAIQKISMMHVGWDALLQGKAELARDFQKRKSTYVIAFAERIQMLAEEKFDIHPSTPRTPETPSTP